MNNKPISTALKLLVPVLLAALVSCGPVTKEKMIEATNSYKLPYGPKKDKALIYVLRNNPFGGLVKFNIYVDALIDDNWAGGCLGGQFIHLYVSPGTHTLFSKTEGPVASVSFNTQAGKIYYAQLNATSGVFVANPLLSALDDLTGKYYLMDCKEGDQGKENF
ncbi:MAG TPA: hypothetical protein PK926_03195 [Spirochaetota bacterium]|nr:hypothetical protein [Spirochaetota bacterium]HPI88743.1 hypothetical protein [Spirochaetota bacterium]HPR47182.1 hypothetical protein [Spirochaetota bacterium]